MTTQSKTDIAILPLWNCFVAILCHRDVKALNYCINYTKHAAKLLNIAELKGESSTYKNEMRVQLLYIINNMTHWRGDAAKQVRASLKHHVKELGA